MKTSADLGNKLQEARERKKIKLVDLVDRTGLTAVTLRNVLEGKTDPRLSTIVALAHEVGLELVLLPKEVAQSFEAQTAAPEAVVSLVKRALGQPATHVIKSNVGVGIQKVSSQLGRNVQDPEKEEP